MVGILAAVVGGGVLGVTLRPDPYGEQFDLSYHIKVLDAKNGVLEVRVNASHMKSRNLYLTTASTDAQGSHLPMRIRLREAETLAGGTASVERGENHWKIRAKGGGVELRYEAWLKAGLSGGEFTRQTLSQIDEHGARLVGSDLFVFPVFGAPRNIRVSYELPESWALINPFQTGENTAVYPDVKSLYHSAVGLGEYRTLERTVRDCRLRVAIRGKYRFLDQDLLDTVSQLAAVQMDIFGGALRREYVFLVNPHPLSGDPQTLRYFGLHYDGSMILLIDSNTDRDRLQKEPAQLCAHEFYHNWCGELIRQHRYDMNWFIEGVTEFYAYQTRLEANIMSFPEYASVLNERYHTEYETSPLRGKVSLDDAGKEVLVDAETTRFMYSCGLFVASALDAEIDELSQQKYSLDDLMYRLARKASQDSDFVLTRQTLETNLRELTGFDFHDWLQSYVYSTKTPRLPSYITREMAMR
jgi:predicted metalloprotease with PDZ domain